MIPVVVLAAAAAIAAAAPVPEIDVSRTLQSGQAALASRDLQKAKAEFRAILAVEPEHLLAHLNLGIIALVENKPADGLAHFALLPNDPRALIGRLDCELRLGRSQEARSTAARLNEIVVQDSAANEYIGKLLYNAGEYSAARSFLRRVARATGAGLLGLAEEKSGDLNAATNAFSVAVRLDPASEDYRIDLGAVLLNSGRVEESVRVFRSAAADFPNSARVQLGLGSALYFAGNYRTSAEAILKAVRVNPEPRAFDLLGKVYEAAGDLQGDVRNEFRKYLARNPSDSVAYTHYGVILSATGDTPAAREALARALKLNPDLAAAHLHLGIIEQSSDHWDEALQHYRRAADLDSGNSAVHYRLAAVYRHVGDRPRADAELAHFRRLKLLEQKKEATVVP